MRVLFLSQIVPYPPHGGVLQRGFNLVRDLSRRVELHLMAFVHPDVLPTPEKVAESRKVLGELCAAVEYFPLWAKKSKAHKLLAIGNSASSSTPFSVIAHRSAAFAKRVDENLRSRPFDILHVDTIALSQFVPPSSGVATVLTHHNIESMLMARRGQVESRQLARRFLQRESAKLEAYERDQSPRFDMNVMMSVPDANALERLAPGSRIAVVPNGVDTDYFSPDGGGHAAALIYTGGMNMFANSDAVMYFLNQIWPRIVAKAPDVQFFAVGQDPPKELRAIAAADSRVVVTGYVDDIRPFVRKAAVYVVPLRVGGGTRLKVLDAMSMGKAMVSTSVGCEGIDVVNGRHLVIADEPESFANATIALLNDDARRQALSRAARARAEELYAWPVIGRQLFDAYETAIAARRANSPH
jgi:sugar transferase (PEP-CTERM/EpsH1 system associated)